MKREEIGIRRVDGNGRGTSRARAIRKGFACASAAFAALTALCGALSFCVNTLGADRVAGGVASGALYACSLGLFLATSGRFFLDIMYGFFGLLQVRISGLALWFALSAASLIPLAGIFVVRFLAAGLAA